MGVSARYRDKGGEIGRKYGDTLIAHCGLATAADLQRAVPTTRS